MRRLVTLSKWLAMVVGGLLSMAVLWFSFVSWRAGACLQEQLQAIRQTGDPVALAELKPAPVPPDRNAATFLRRAEKSAQAIDKELSGLSGDYYEQGRLNQRGVELVESALVAYPDALPLIEQAADAPDYLPDHDYTLPSAFMETYLQKVQTARQAARLLYYRGDLLLAQQKREESLRNGLTLLRLDRHFQREPLLVGYLVSIAIQSMGVSQIARGLADGPIPSELHDQINTEISKHLESPAFVATIRTERAYGIESFRDFRGLGLPGFFKQDECDYLKLMAAEIAIGNEPTYKVQAALDKMKIEVQGTGPLTKQMWPALEASREAYVRSLARLQCLRVLSALSRSNQGTEAKPPSIDDLRLPDEIRLDPYIGQSLKIKQTEAGWIVYSVGPNLKDDGGNLEKNEDVGVGPEG